MKRFALIQDGRVHHVFDAEEKPVVAPGIVIVDLSHLEKPPKEGAVVINLDTATFEDPPPPEFPKPEPPRPVPVRELFRPPIERVVEHQAAVQEAGYFGNVWVRKLYWAKAGDEHPGHAHQFDHISLLVKGSVRLQQEGDPVAHEYAAPAYIQIPKQVRHHFTALEDDTLLWCIFALRDATGDVVDEIGQADLTKVR